MLIQTDELGIPKFSNKNLIDLIYSGHSDKCHVVLCDMNTDVDKFNEAAEKYGFSKLQKYIPLEVDKKTFDDVCQSEWLMPDHYKHLNVEDYLLARLCVELKNSNYQSILNTDEWRRIIEELMAFNKHGMGNLLKYLIYLVDFMRENNIIWGVGRGSSVASYVLYLIGIHKVNSIKYNLDWKEFLR